MGSALLQRGSGLAGGGERHEQRAGVAAEKGRSGAGRVDGAAGLDAPAVDMESTP